MLSRPAARFGEDERKAVCLRWVGLGNNSGKSPENTTDLVFEESSLNLKK